MLHCLGKREVIKLARGPTRLAAMFAVSNNSPRFAAFCRRYSGRLSQIIILQFAPCSFPSPPSRPSSPLSLFLSFPSGPPPRHPSVPALARFARDRPPLEAWSINLSMKRYIENLFSPRLPRPPPSALGESRGLRVCRFNDYVLDA